MYESHGYHNTYHTLNISVIHTEESSGRWTLSESLAEVEHFRPQALGHAIRKKKLSFSASTGEPHKERLDSKPPQEQPCLTGCGSYTRPSLAGAKLVACCQSIVAFNYNAELHPRILVLHDQKLCKYLFSFKSLSIFN